MSNIANLTQELAKKSRELVSAQNAGVKELAEQLSAEINDIEDEIDRAEQNSRDGGYGWS